ncbi:hypothetical protein ACQ4PT_045487 [Festuca glaucescens]
MIRRVLNLLVHNTTTGVHSLRRIDPYKHLFYQSAAEAAAESNQNKREESALEMQTLALPDPIVSFAPSPTYLPTEGALHLFALLRSRGSEGRIVSADLAGESVLFDADERLFLNLPRLNEPKGWKPACLSIALPGTLENSLYVMDRRHSPSCFEVLEFGPRRGGPEVRDMHTGWRWRFLPPPPFALRPGYETSYVTSYTSMVNANGCSTICISSSGNGIGTYCFDTSRHLEEWRHTGAWKLPFQGKAEYIPEFKLWFGFSAHTPNHLCAVDLSAMQQDQQQPTLLYCFEDLNPPVKENWAPMSLELVNLGAGKFCVSKSFDAAETIGQQFAVLSGIEIVRGYDQRLHMVKHKRTCYTFSRDIINCVF